MSDSIHCYILTGDDHEKGIRDAIAFYYTRFRVKPACVFVNPALGVTVAEIDEVKIQENERMLPSNMVGLSVNGVFPKGRGRKGVKSYED